MRAWVRGAVLGGTLLLGAAGETSATTLSRTALPLYGELVPASATSWERKPHGIVRLLPDLPG